MKKIDWFKRFVNLAIKHKIWYSVCADGCIDEMSFTEIDVDYEVPYIKIGTKAAYLWLKETIEENKDEV